MQSFESFNELSLPHQVNIRFQELERRDSEGTLTPSERQELKLIIEAKQTLAELRAKAKKLRESALAAPCSVGQSVRNGLPVVQVPPGTPLIDPDAVRRFLQEATF